MKPLNKVTILAPAKVNLFLHVVGKTSNNYHLLQSLVYFTDFGDKITVEESDKFSFENTGITIPKKNSIIDATEHLSKILQQPLNCKITLDKKIPMGGGLGGGSSDAATTIKALLKLWNAKIKPIQLNELLISLGADVPSCYMAQAGYFEGIGEHVKPISNAPQLHAILCNPNKHSATENIFKNFDSQQKTPIALPHKFKTTNNLIEFLETTENDLTKSACQTAPDIIEMLNILNAEEKTLLSRMSGSGSTCFTLAENKSSAIELEKKLKSNYPEWWWQAVTLN